MTITNDTIKNALRMLGYEGPWIERGAQANYWVDKMGRTIPTDLASLLKRCREREIRYCLRDRYDFKVRVYLGKTFADLKEMAVADDELDAVLLALAAAWDAQEKTMTITSVHSRLNEMSETQRSLLLFLETQAVDHGGRVDSR